MATADYPAAASYGPWVASTSAAHPWRHCRWKRPKKIADSDDDSSDADEQGAERPSGSTSGNRRGSQSEDRGDSFMLRAEDYTWPQIQTELQQVQAMTTKKEKKVKMAACGFNTVVFPLNPEYIPLVDPTRMQPEDIMHLFLCGITRHELYYLVEYLVKHKFITWEALNSRIAGTRIPKGKRIPKVHAAPKGKKPSERHLDMTASEVLIFATLRYLTHRIMRESGPLVCSLSILEPILSPEARELSIWESWVRHRQLLMFVTRTSFEVHEVEELGNLVHAYLTAFNKVQAHTFTRAHSACACSSAEATRFDCL